MVRPTVISEHASDQARRRGVDVSTVRKVASAPEEVVPVRRGREVRQAVVRFPPDGKLYLVRVFVDLGASEDTVVTVYRTSKIKKYRSLP